MDENGGSESVTINLLHDRIIGHSRLHPKSNLFLLKKRSYISSTFTPFSQKQKWRTFWEMGLVVGSTWFDIEMVAMSMKLQVTSLGNRSACDLEFGYWRSEILLLVGCIVVDLVIPWVLSCCLVLKVLLCFYYT